MRLLRITDGGMFRLLLESAEKLERSINLTITVRWILD